MRGRRDDADPTLWDYLVVHSPRPRGDVLMCFGCRDLGVPRRAAELFHDGTAPTVLVSGSSVDGAACEALIFTGALLDHGVPRDAIVLEQSAAHTGENVAFGMARLAEAGLVPRRAVLVSWPLSARRCRATFIHQFPEVEVDSAPSGPPAGHHWPSRARAVRAALGEFDRLQRYADRGLLRPQPLPRRVEKAAAELRSAAGELDRLLVHEPLEPVLERS